MAKQYVQHISGQGEKWEMAIDQSHSEAWTVCAKGPGYLYLPKSDYRLCDPPERWTDVTKECELRTDSLNRQQIWHGQTCIDCAIGYQFRKVQLDVPNGGKLAHDQQWAFLVERRETP